MGVIDRPEPVPTGAIGALLVGGRVTESVMLEPEPLAATGGIKFDDLIGACIVAGRGGVALAAETIVELVEPGDDCVEGELLDKALLFPELVAFEVAIEGTQFPNGAGNPLAGDCSICTGGGRMGAGALVMTDDDRVLPLIVVLETAV